MTTTLSRQPVDRTQDTRDGRGPERFDVVVISGGQAGLAVGHHLARHALRFVILDASDRVGDSWRKRWDTLRVFTPARYDGLPGMPFPAPPHSFPTKDEVADFLEAYALRMDLPVRNGVNVELVSRIGAGYIVSAGAERFEAAQVVIATGAYHHPRVPDFATGLDPRIRQLHACEFRNPSQLREGAVLVVGASNSGAEIAHSVAGTHQTWLSGRSSSAASSRPRLVSTSWDCRSCIRSPHRSSAVSGGMPRTSPSRSRRGRRRGNNTRPLSQPCAGSWLDRPGPGRAENDEEAMNDQFRTQTITADQEQSRVARSALPVIVGQGFVGSWLLTFFEADGPPTLALATFGAEGTVVTAEHPVVTPPIATEAIFTSSGHGAWEATGPDTAVFTVVGLGSYGQGILFGTATARATITLGADGQTFSGEVVWTVADREGNPLATFPGTFQATRIVARAPTG